MHFSLKFSFLVPQNVMREESESVIFGALSSGDASRNDMKVHAEISQLGKKVGGLYLFDFSR